jgi:hypothetical protein
MKYTALRNRLTALEARLSLKPAKVIIIGGLPPDFEPAQPAPPGHELRAQAREFRRARQAPNSAASAPAAAGLPETPEAPPDAITRCPEPRVDQSLVPRARRAAYRSRKRDL